MRAHVCVCECAYLTSESKVFMPIFFFFFHNNNKNKSVASQRDLLQVLVFENDVNFWQRLPLILLFISVHLTHSIALYETCVCAHASTVWVSKYSMDKWLQSIIFETKNTAVFDGCTVSQSPYSLWLIYQHLICNLQFAWLLALLHSFTFVCLFSYAKNNAKCITVWVWFFSIGAQLIRNTIYRLKCPLEISQPDSIGEHSCITLCL